MPQYKLFISHSWTYADAHEKLLDLFGGNPPFRTRIMLSQRTIPSTMLPIRTDSTKPSENKLPNDRL